MNSINIIGRIGKEIELKFLASGSAIANFSIAVDQSYKKDGQKVEKTSWFDITAFGKTGEIINQYFSKGSMIGISGELEQQTWTDQSGANKSKVVIKLKDFTFIDKANNTQQPHQVPTSYEKVPQHTDYREQPKQQVQPQRQQSLPPVIDIDEDEIPF